MSAAGMLLAVVANVPTFGGCDAYLSSDLLDCVPWGRLIDLGHAIAAFGACAVCAFLVATPSVGVVEKRVARIGFVVMALTGVLHLASLTGLSSHTDLFVPLVLLWASAGVWIGLQSVRRRPFDLVSILGISLAITGVVWAQVVSQPNSDHAAVNDALLLAGSAYFALGYPFWIALVADPGPHPRRPPRYAANAVVAMAQRLGIVVGGAVITIVVLLPFWYFATFQPVLGDPGPWRVHVTNVASEPLNVSALPDGRVVQIQPGKTADLEWGPFAHTLAIVASDLPGARVFCQVSSAREVLHARLRVTVLKRPETCSGR